MKPTALMCSTSAISLTSKCSRKIPTGGAAEDPDPNWNA